jgi:hypothetical protein
MTAYVSACYDIFYYTAYAEGALALTPSPYKKKRFLPLLTKKGIYYYICGGCSRSHLLALKTHEHKNKPEN